MTSNSSSLLPELSHGVGMVVGLIFLLVVAAGAAIIIGVMVQKNTGRPNILGRQLGTSKFLLPFAGAMILGSVSGMVLWSSDQYQVAKVDQPERVTAAYKNIKSIETEKANLDEQAVGEKKSEENADAAKKLLGEDKFNELNEKYDLTDSNDPKRLSSAIEFVPSADDPSVSDKCHKIKVSYTAKVDTFDPKAPVLDHTEWVDPPGYSEDECGGEAEKF